MVGLGDQQRIGVDPQLPGVFRIQGVFGVDKGGYAPFALGAGNGVERHGGFTG